MDSTEKTSLRLNPNSFNLACFFSVIVLGINLAVVFLIAGQELRSMLMDVISPIVDVLACIALFISVRQYTVQTRRLALAWGTIALAAFFTTLGDATWAILEVGLKQQPFPSIADGFYLTTYPVFLIGVLLLPANPSSTAEKINRAMDIGIVMLAAILGFWNFLIGPMLLSNAGLPQLEQLILLAYPVADLVLFGAALLIINNRSTGLHDGSLLLLAGSLLATIVTDSIFDYQSLLGTYVSGGLVDVGWVIGTLLLGLAGINQIVSIKFSKREGTFAPDHKFLGRWNTIVPFLPYLWLVASYILLIRSGLEPLSMSFLSLSMGVGGIICLVLVRQLITLTQNNKLNARLKNANLELQVEIGEHHRVEEKLSYDALHDALTGLANRILFLDRLGQVIGYAKRRAEYRFAVLFLDLDQFKVVNDSLGHLLGDQLLVLVAQRLKDALRSTDTIARFGGDEFEILLDNTVDKASVLIVAQKIKELLHSPFKLEGHELYITASIGIVSNLVGYEYAEDILRDADIAMYQAKASGKDRYEIFDIHMRTQAYSRLEMENEMRLGLERNEFQLYYQPIVSLDSNRLAGFEALIRWLHPKRGLLLPMEFLPIAEESGLILPIGNWVLHKACGQLKSWQEKFPNLQNVCVNVNISSKQFSHSIFIQQVILALQTSGLKAGSLKLEITEGVLISNYALANEVFIKLQALGVELQIDDFGTGYSALGYLQHFPINAIKIDRTFVNEMSRDRKSTELVRAIISMAREMGMETIAEGIETEKQLSELKGLACGYGQGFLLSRPLDIASTEEVIANLGTGVKAFNY
jgi:diguanylate cyclase (GGDEF)-like protein